MIVEELIEELKKMNPQANVVIALRATDDYHQIDGLKMLEDGDIELEI